MRPLRPLRPLRAARTLALLLAAWPALAGAMEPLDDRTLSSVRGGDGVSFDLSGFSIAGNARVTYTTASGSSVYIDNLAASRSDSAVPFSDPYKLDIVAGAPGLADVINVAFPLNANAEQRWQFAYDWGVTANGVASANGTIALSDLVVSGGGLQFSTPQAGDGVAFGAALRLDIGQLAFQPNGRDNPAAQMVVSGVHVGGVDANGNFNGTPWALAAIASQPGVINAVTDESGARLHIGIDWPDARYGSGVAPAGGIAIDKVAFTAPGQATVDLGASRIGSIQIQYLDIKFKN
ncbi:DUF6160 family protein [Rugamonas sp.]|uniref:DUF6160 family protein n=1 Tax=Rugamonas sp. TaxID=1926287 RepID=UPI0025E78E18|nr:DUF6160 family protein [Rugamonas sp.]